MTWSEFTKKYGKPITISNNPIKSVDKSIIPATPLINPMNDKCYKDYALYFSNRDIIKLDLSNWYANNWVLYQEEYFIGKIDFHGLNKSETQYWLEYFQKNRHYFAKNVQLITGRGNNSNTRIHKDISTVIISKNDSTGVLEDFVFRWLNQNKFKFIKRPGSFEVIS